MLNTASVGIEPSSQDMISKPQLADASGCHVKGTVNGKSSSATKAVADKNPGHGSSSIPRMTRLESEAMLDCNSAIERWLSSLKNLE